MVLSVLIHCRHFPLFFTTLFSRAYQTQQLTANYIFSHLSFVLIRKLYFLTSRRFVKKKRPFTIPKVFTDKNLWEVH